MESWAGNEYKKEESQCLENDIVKLGYLPIHLTLVKERGNVKFPHTRAVFNGGISIAIYG